MDTSNLGPVVGLVVDSSILIQAERGKITTPEVMARLSAVVGIVPIVLCAITIAELGHGIYHTTDPERAIRRRRFLDGLLRHFHVHPVSETTAEIMARVGGEQARRGITVPYADLIIGACALELGYAVATHNARHFRLIPALDVRSL